MYDPILYDAVNACFKKSPHDVFKHYAAEEVFDNLGVDTWFDLIQKENLDILAVLIDVGVSKGVNNTHSMWGLIASGVAQNQCVAILNIYGKKLPLAPYLRECCPPFNEDFFRALSQYVSVDEIHRSRDDIAEFFDMVQQKDLLVLHTQEFGASKKRKL